MGEIISKEVYTIRCRFIPESLFVQESTNGLRRPYYDVGEHLPIKNSFEIDIARISLASSTGDVIVIRAVKSDNLYSLKVLDEYEGIFIDFTEEYNHIPTQGEIIDLISEFNDQNSTNTGYLFEVLEENSMTTKEQVEHYVIIDSNIYPDLNSLFLYRWQKWVQDYGN
jgi:hypothetical protein